MNDETEIRRSNTSLRALSQLDGLTGLYNRRSFDQVLAENYQRVRSGGHNPLAVAIIDVDHFKLYNDNYGHQTGDQCLQFVARILQACCRANDDMAFRYGGEEFAIIMPDTSIAAATRIAERVRSKIRSLKMAHAKSSFGVVTVSIGLASSEAGCKSEGEILNLADNALYEAKRGGRDQIRSATVSKMDPGLIPAADNTRHSDAERS